MYSEGRVISSKQLKAILLACGLLLVFGFMYSVIAMILGMLTFFVSVTVWSVGHYNAISLDKDILKVGKDTVDIRSLDTLFGAKNAEDALSAEQMDSLEIGLSGQRPGITILGGSYGRPKTGSKWIALKQTSATDIMVLSSVKRGELVSQINSRFLN